MARCGFSRCGSSVRWLFWPLALVLGAAACHEAGAPNPEEVPVRVGLVGLDSRNLPVVVLEEEGGPRTLHIWIGLAEARSIAAQIEDRPSPRPNTHDLAKRLIQGLDGEVVRVVVSDLREGTFYAILTLRSNGRLVDIDARPSDAIAIALRTKSSIFVREAVFEAAGSPVESGEEGRRIRLEPVPPAGPPAIGI